MRQPQSLARPQKLLGEAKGVPSSAERTPISPAMVEKGGGGVRAKRLYGRYH